MRNFTEIPSNAPANALTFNIPLGQLDKAIVDMVQNNNRSFGSVTLETAVVQQISAGYITTGDGFYILEAESGTTDDLDEIQAANNTVLFLKAQTNHVIRIVNTTNIDANNLFLWGDQVVCLVCDNDEWSVYNLPMINKFSNYLFCSGLELSTDRATNIVTIQPGECSSDNGYINIESPTTLTVDMADSGIGGLDTGTVGATTLYYIWILYGSSGVGCVASTSPTAPTTPAGYTSYKRRIGAVYTGASSTLLSGYTPVGQGNSRRFYFTEVTYPLGPYTLLNDADIGTSGARTAISFTGIAPDTSTSVICQIRINTGSGAAQIMWSTGTNPGDMFVVGINSTTEFSISMHDLPKLWLLNSAEIYSTAAVDEDITLIVFGWVDDGLANLGYTP